MELRPYQAAGRDWLAARDKALLADAPRVGKTPQAILAAAKAGARSALVLTPAVAVLQWRTEWKRWGGPGKPEVYSHEKARALFTEGYFTDKRYDVFIVDECHKARNPNAAVTKMIYGKEGLSWKSGATWALSGTPAPKHCAELWPLLRAFGAVNMSYNAFVDRYCWLSDRLSRRIGGTKESMIPELREILAPLMLRRTIREAAPEMPVLDFQYLNVQGRGDLLPQGVPPTDEDLLGWLESNAAHEAEFRIACALAKVPALADEVTNAIEGELLDRVVVFGHHVEPLKTLARTLTERGIEAHVLNGSTGPKDRVRIQEKFRQGEFPVLCANIMTAGTAIPLHWASHCYFLELAWTPADNVQAAFRLVHVTKAEPVTAAVVTWPGSFDDRISKVLMRRVRELSAMGLL